MNNLNTRNPGVIALLTLCTALAACSQQKNETQPARPNVTVAPISISKEMKLVNAVQNLEGLETEKRLEAVQMLLEDGASPDAENEFGEPVLADAIHFGNGESYDLRVVELLLEKGADVNKIGPTGRSPLTKAAESGKTNVIELLLAKGLVLNTENGGHALIKAAFHGHKQVVQLFVRHGYKPSGRYEKALLSVTSEEVAATAAVFGAFVDIANDELNALLGANSRAGSDRELRAQLERIDASCTAINHGSAITDNMGDFFNRTEECSSMGRLGSLAYMHCYGLLLGNSASLQGLQGHISRAAASARAVMEWRQVRFGEVKSSSELIAYDKAIRRSLALYNDMVLPWTRSVAGKMSHHSGRNRQLQAQAASCGNKAILGGAKEIASAVGGIEGSHKRQLESFRQEIAAMEKMRASIIYQLPALSAGEELKRREEEKKNEEEKKAKART